MPSEKHFRHLEEYYHAGPCNQYYKPKLTISHGEAEVAVQARTDFFHGRGAVHGSVYFKMLDDAAYFAVNSLYEDAFVLTLSFNVYFVRPVKTGIMTARGKVVSRSPNLYVAESELVDEKGRLLARGIGNFSKTKARPKR